MNEQMQTERDDLTVGDARKLMMDWATGKRSHFNTYGPPRYSPEVVSAMDAQEVVRWAAVFTALRLEARDG